MEKGYMGFRKKKWPALKRGQLDDSDSGVDGGLEGESVHCLIDNQTDTGAS